MFHGRVGKQPMSLPIIVLTALLAAYSLARPLQAQNNLPANAPVIEEKLPTLFVIGDSTARNGTGGAKGWGDALAEYFDTTKIRILNRAMAGRSSRTFLTDGRWERVLGEMKAGDFVLIQFGHNDGGAVDGGRGRGSLAGTGEETQEITKPDGEKEIVHTFGWYLRRFITDTRAKGAVPIVLSLTVRNVWKEGKVERGSGKFNQWATEVAGGEGVGFVDVTQIIADHYEKLGQDKVRQLFGPDYVHTSPAGADLNAASVVAGLKGKLNTLGKDEYLSSKGKGVEPYPARTS